MKPKFPRWTNPYIDKVESLPDYLAPCYGAKPSEEELLLLKHKVSSFEHIYCELGCGSGKHLIERALQDPEGCYIGFELRYKRAFKSASKAAQRNLHNVFVMRTNVFLLPSFFEADSLDGVYVNFPDPWDKKRWADNRILNPFTLKSILRLLKPGAFLSYKTDHIERFRETIKMLQATEGFKILHCTEDLYSSELLNDSISSEFEGLFRSKNLSICYMKAVK